MHTRGNETNSAYQSAAVGAYKNEPFFNDNQQHNVIIEYSQGVRAPPPLPVQRVAHACLTFQVTEARAGGGCWGICNMWGAGAFESRS